MSHSPNNSHGRVKVMVFGTFNIVHPGHIRLLNFAKDLGDSLVVGVLSDEIAGPSAHLGQTDRLEAISAIGIVDHAFLVTTSIADEIRKHRPAFVVKGKEFEGRSNLEEEVVGEYGGQLLFSSGESHLSSTKLMIRELVDPLANIGSMPADFMKRHSIERSALREIVKRFQKMTVSIVGDVIIDEYIDCEPLGMSQEEISLVVSPVETSTFLGGAGIVAAHAAGLGASAEILSVVGDDETGKFASSELARFGVDAHLIVDGTRPTTLKQRFRSEGKSLLRVSRLSQRQVSQTIQRQINSELKSRFSQLDLLIVSDFNYGVVTDSTSAQITDLRSNDSSVVVAADSQSSSQIGDISRFRGLDLITPTEREARLPLRNSTDGLVVISELLGEVTQSSHVLLKLGSEGLLINSRESADLNWSTDQLPALNHRAADVAGAGDCMLVVSSLALAVGANIWEAALLGSVGAALQVSRTGNLPLTASELVSVIDR